MTIAPTAAASPLVALASAPGTPQPAAALGDVLAQLTNALTGLTAALAGASTLGGGAPSGGASGCACQQGSTGTALVAPARPSSAEAAGSVATAASPVSPKPSTSTAAQLLGGEAGGSHAAEIARAQKRATSSGIGDVVAGKISWYGGPNDGQDNDKPASGVPNTVPGIAVMNSRTLGGWWEVTMSDGRKVRLQQTDIGPAAWTGKKLDFNHTAVKQLGYTEQNFPTGGSASARYLGPSPD